MNSNRIEINTPDWALDLVKDLPLLVTKKEASKFLRRSERSLQRDVNGGRLRALKTGNAGSARVLFARTELARFISTM